MIDLKLRKQIRLFTEVNELEEEDMPLILDNPNFDNSIIGISNDNRLIYSYQDMINEFANDNECSEEEAQEFIDYNTIRAIPYFPKAPIIIMEDRETLKNYELYEEEGDFNEAN